MKYVALQAGVVVITAALLTANPALASDGRIELNQASIEAAGGFPYTIDDPGSYVLTSSLIVPANTDGLLLGSPDISIDLNGFVIQSTALCIIDSCPLGDGEGIRKASDLFGDGRNATVRNGSVVGFGNHCVRLSDYARVSELTVVGCGQTGITVGIRSTVTGNRVSNTGRAGLSMPETGVYSHNTFSQAGLADAMSHSVSGGKATAGNYCDDGQCGWVDTRRRFYATTDAHIGSAALAACDTGFHMASLWELQDFTQLRYDTSRGYSASDMGSGPPNTLSAWIRTGRGSSVADFTGRANCAVWESDEVTEYGTVANPQSYWHPSQGGASADLRISGWAAGTTTCDMDLRVWCVED